jgi:hypothetical protein
MDEVVKMLAQSGQEIGVPWDLEPIGEKVEQAKLR